LAHSKEGQVSHQYGPIEKNLPDFSIFGT